MKRTLVWILAVVVLSMCVGGAIFGSQGQWPWDIRGVYKAVFTSIPSAECPEVTSNRFVLKIEQNMQTGSEVWGEAKNSNGETIFEFKAQIKPWDRKRCDIIEGAVEIQGEKIKFDGKIMKKSAKELLVIGRFWKDGVICKAELQLKKQPGM